MPYVRHPATMTAAAASLTALGALAYLKRQSIVVTLVERGAFRLVENALVPRGKRGPSILLWLPRWVEAAGVVYIAVKYGRASRDRSPAGSRAEWSDATVSESDGDLPPGAEGVADDAAA